MDTSATLHVIPGRNDSTDVEDAVWLFKVIQGGGQSGVALGA